MLRFSSFYYIKYIIKDYIYLLGSDTPIIFKNPDKIGFKIRKILVTISVGHVWIVIEYFLFEKQAVIAF